MDLTRTFGYVPGHRVNLCQTQHESKPLKIFPEKASWLKASESISIGMTPGVRQMLRRVKKPGKDWRG